MRPASSTEGSSAPVALEWQSGNWPPDGLDYHVAFGPSSDLRVSEIWDSREKWEAFLEHLMPLLADAGIQVAGEPEVFEVHNTTKR